MKVFLKLKHWQLFLIWIIIEIIFISTVRTNIWILTTELFGFSIIGWIYSIGKVTNNLNDVTKIENYKEDVWFVLYLVSIIIFGYHLRSIYSYEPANGLLSFSGGLLGFISSIKLVNFSAKAYKQYENKKVLKFDDYSREFMQIIFFVIGVWTIQPKLNKIVRTTELRS